MKRVLITGGSRGLGLALCRKLLDEQWHVLTTARRATDAVRELQAQYAGRFEFWEADLAEAEEVQRLCVAARVLEGLDGFVANAALGTEGLLTLTSEPVMRQTLDVNLLAPMLLAKQVVKGMLPRGGSLVFVSSVAAVTGLSGLTVYGATKGALVAFSRAVAREYGERGIRSNCVLPGFLETEMSASLEEAQRVRLRRRTALGRLGQVEDVVGAVSFLLSPAAAFVTGTELIVDGGMRA
ncbi:MAG: SDR family oxidoreductase [Verrucomicrobiales bacterium]|nr:SDR family oxidoreductase [Verrucomicrobiales bacterium]